MEIFACAAEACSQAGIAEEMYNIPCSPDTVTREALKKKVRCEPCANEHVRNERTVNGRPNATVFRLSDTLRLVDRFAPDGAYLRWHLESAGDRAHTEPREDYERGYLDWYRSRNPKSDADDSDREDDAA